MRKQAEERQKIQDKIKQMNSCQHEFKLESEKMKLEKCVRCDLVKRTDEWVDRNHYSCNCGCLMVTQNGVSYRCPRCGAYRLPNKVKMLPKMSKDIYFSRAEDTIEITKNTWACLTCGRVWFLRQDAEACRHTNFVMYGQKVVQPVGRIKLEAAQKV